ncbi:MAG: aminoglycoside phosphotransferase family protein [Actinomycetia bacterium]|nr:aminoglycoside phosphotransferase family protein [Actinomycetes bacterium]
MKSKANIKVKDISGFSKIRKFYSKRNEVYLVEDSSDSVGENYVLKIFKGRQKEKRKRIEENFLKDLSKSFLNVPELLLTGKDYLLMEYIKGDTFLDILIQHEEGSSCDDRPFLMVIDFIYDFYRHTLKSAGQSYILKDINLRNFIYKGDQLYQIDFEDCAPGYIEEDLGKLFAFILTYDPVFTDWKISRVKDLFKYLSDKYSADIDSIRSEMKKELISIEDRRSLEIPFDKIDKYHI